MRKNFNLPSLRKRLAEASGEKYWRSLDEVAETEEFQDFLHHEFPQGADQWLSPIGRRNFLKLMAASFALGGLTACSPQAAKKIVPYVRTPEEVIPGNPLYFATAFQLGGIATGLVAQSHEGRPTKLDGNPDHPGSLGGTNALAQATVLSLYDPDRSQSVTNAGLVSSWNAFLNQFILETAAQGITGGSGLRILTEAVTSPTMAAQFAVFAEKFPQAKVVEFEPVNRDNIIEGAKLAFGEAVNPVYHFDQANVILSLEADFMGASTGGDVRYAHDFTQMRRVSPQNPTMNRLYLAESTPSITGAMADHRLPLKSSRIETLARAVAAAVGVAVAPPGDSHGLPEKWVAAVAKDLQATAGKSLVLAGISQPPVVHALAHAINDKLGNVGVTVTYTEPLTALSPTQTQTLAELVADMQAGLVKVLIILEANPVYNAPVDEPFTEALQMVPYRVRVGLYEDETSALCHWHVPAKHFLESWGDARAYDGTVTLIQPLIEPLYPAAHNAVEVMAAILGQLDVTNYDLIRGHWEQNTPIRTGTFDDFWKQALYNGFIPDSALPPKQVSASPASLTADSTALTPDEGMELVFRPDPSVWDGSFANNGWLQELPKPLTKLTWDNAVLISPVTADSLGVASGDVVNINYNGRAIFGPVWVMPGQADDSVTLFLGYGRTRAGRVGNGVGVSAYKLRTAAAPWFTGDVTLRKSGDTYPLASTQMHWNMEGRHIVKGGTLAEYQADPHFVKHIGHHEVDPNLSLMPGWEYNSYKWGMVIDLNACNGCNACVTACQAENNVPIVGKEHVLNGREMHWLRLDTYYEGGLDNPQPLHQPMMCQHCEQAPCELVCPVNATVHDAEGLNVMVYNRCIGTRYCSNNCPYKVRRFNYLQYSDQTTESLKAVNNPNVTVRVRGVMEKCTYCIQRISQARIQAKNENRRIGDGEVVTACQSACPTKAIIFGDLNDETSAVAKLSKDSRGYTVLSELGVRPRTTYLAKLTNPNPELANEATAGEDGH